MSGVTEARLIAGGDGSPPRDPGCAVLEPAHLREAFDSRGVVGFAAGVVAERYRLTPEQAWSALVQLSQHTNTKVRVIARLVHAARGGGTFADADAELARLLNRRWPLRGGGLIALPPDGRPD